MDSPQPEKTSVRITDGPLLSVSTEESSDPTAGASLVFEGRVRPLENDELIQALDYEVYAGMAERQLRRLAETTQERFAVLRVRVEHSRGIVPVGQCSFRLVIEARHRQEAFAAGQWFIDTMKRDVPIWKRPVSVAAEGATAPTDSDTDQR